MATLFPLQRQNTPQIHSQSGSIFPGKSTIWMNTSRDCGNDRSKTSPHYPAAPLSHTLPATTDYSLLSDGEDDLHHECPGGRTAFGISPPTRRDCPDMCGFPNIPIGPRQLMGTSRNDNKSHDAPSSSPMASLLWAHQLHVENKALESRLKDIEKAAVSSQEKASSLQNDDSYRTKEMESRLESFQAQVSKEMQLAKDREVKIVRDLEAQLSALKTDFQESRRQQYLEIQTSLSRVREEAEERSNNLKYDINRTSTACQKRKREQDKATKESGNMKRNDAAIAALRQELSELKNEVASKNISKTPKAMAAKDAPSHPETPRSISGQDQAVAPPNVPDIDAQSQEGRDPSLASPLLEPQVPTPLESITPIRRKRPRHLSSLTGTPTVSHVSSPLRIPDAIGASGRVRNGPITSKEEYYEAARTGLFDATELSPWRDDRPITMHRQSEDYPFKNRENEFIENAEGVNKEQLGSPKAGLLVSPSIIAPDPYSTKTAGVSPQLNARSIKREQQNKVYGNDRSTRCTRSKLKTGSRLQRRPPRTSIKRVTRAAAAKGKKTANRPLHQTFAGLGKKEPAASTIPEQASSTRCVCADEDDNGPMICCDECDAWLHCDCVGISEKQSKSLTRYFCPFCEGHKPAVQDSGHANEKPVNGAHLGVGNTRRLVPKATKIEAPGRDVKAENAPANKPTRMMAGPASRRTQSTVQPKPMGSVKVHHQSRQDDLSLQQYLDFCESLYRKRPIKQRNIKSYVKEFWSGLNNGEDKRSRGMNVREAVKDQLDEHGWRWPIFHKSVQALVNHPPWQAKEEPARDRSSIDEKYMDNHQDSFGYGYNEPSQKPQPQLYGDRRNPRRSRRAIPLVWGDDDDASSWE